MQFDIPKQTFTWEGETYTREAIRSRATQLPANTTDFHRELYDFLVEWYSDSPTITVQTSGSTGIPKVLSVTKTQMMQSARMTCEYLNLQRGDKALLCMSLQYIAGKMMVVRALVAGLNMIACTPSGHPFSNIFGTIRFAAIVPLQLYNTLDSQEELKQMNRIDTLIIGGGMINPSYAERLRHLPGNIYATYGMTETLSHIALCKLNGSDTDYVSYFPLPGVKLSLSSVGTLTIEAPAVCNEKLVTHDLVRLSEDGRFLIIGRADNVINSGGIKIQPEVLEAKLQSVLTVPFVVTSVPDDYLGEAVTLLVERFEDIDQIRCLCSVNLPKYEFPRWIFSVEKIPQTENGKIDRPACRRLAAYLK